MRVTWLGGSRLASTGLQPEILLRNLLDATDSSAPDCAPVRNLHSQALRGESGLVQIQVGKRLLHCSVEPFRDASGTVVGCLGLCLDVTGLACSHAAQLQAEKLAVTSRMATTLAHEISNPLQAILGCLGLAEEVLDDGEDPRRYLQLARDEVQRTAYYLATLRDMHRTWRREDRVPVSASVLLRRALELSQRRLAQNRIQVDLELSDSDTVRVIPESIQLVFLNLIWNAIDAMPHGGLLRVHTYLCQEPLRLHIAFHDNGEGIDADEMRHLFTPFYSTRSYGMGLGLFLSYSTIVQHGGRIEASSRLGEGSTFTVCLPM
ncbi:MAG: two-component system sensor histidine kinase NtrB [Anaerolineae bacterium]